MIFKFVYILLLITLTILTSIFMIFLLAIGAYLTSLGMAAIALVFIFEIIRTVYYNPM